MTSLFARVKRIMERRLYRKKGTALQLLIQYSNRIASNRVSLGTERIQLNTNISIT